jgi:hypothetical protein
MPPPALRQGRGRWPLGLKFSGGDSGPKAGGSREPTPRPAEEPLSRGTDGTQCPSFPSCTAAGVASLPPLSVPTSSIPLLDPLSRTLSSLGPRAMRDRRLTDADELCVSFLSAADPSELLALAVVRPSPSPSSVAPSQRGLRRGRAVRGKRRGREEQKQYPVAGADRLRDRGCEGERRGERETDKCRWVPPVRTDEKIGRNSPCFNIW